MSKKKEREFKTIEEEVSFLRNQVAGLKGQNSVLSKQIDEKNKILNRMSADLADKELANDGLESQVMTLTQTISSRNKEILELTKICDDSKETITQYNNLPWIVKMFTFRI